MAVQVRSLLPVGELCDEVEKRNKLRLLDKFLQLLVQEGSQDPQVRRKPTEILFVLSSESSMFCSCSSTLSAATCGGGQARYKSVAWHAVPA